MIFRNKNLKLKLKSTSEHEKPIVTPIGVIKDHYVTDHYNACAATYKKNGDFVTITTGDSRMKQVLQQTRRMQPTKVRIISKIEYAETYRVSKEVWKKILKAHEEKEAPAAPEAASGLYRGFPAGGKG